MATAGSGSSVDERVRREHGSRRSRSSSLPTRAQSQTEYLDSLRALAQAYSSAEQHRNVGNVDNSGLGPDGHVTRLRSATMIDTNRNRGRMDSELTSDSDRTFDLSPGAADAGDVFALPASEDEKSKIISSRLHELDSTQRSWKKRVADYVHGLPVTKQFPAEGGRVQDPKRRRLWSTGCERFPWEINSSDGVVPRQRIYTVSSDSTFSCSQLSTTSSRDSVQHWVDSIDGQEDPDATLTPGHAGNGGRKDNSSPRPAGRKISDHGNGIPKLPPSSADDDLGLGADAESVTGSTKDDDDKDKQVIGPGGKMLVRKLTNSDIISMANQTRALQSRRKQLQRMGSSAMSDTSVASVSDLLFARNDPEELLLNLGFGGGKEPNPLERIPARFLQYPSSASGVSIDNFLMLSETQDQKYGFSLHGGLRGLGAVLQNSVCAFPTSSPYLTCGTDMGGVTSRLENIQSTSLVPEDSRSSVEPVDRIGTSNGREWSIGRAAETQRTDLPHSRQVSQIGAPSDDANPEAKDVAGSPRLARCTGAFLASDPASQNELSTGNTALTDPVASSGCEPLSSSSDSDWDCEEGEPGGSCSRSSEDHRRIRNARMVMLEPLLPPVHEELETTPTAQSRKLRAKANPDAGQGSELNTEEVSSGKESRVPSEGCSPPRGEELGGVEKRTASLTPERATPHLTHTPESFEIEEISSTENQEDGSAVSRTADQPPEKGALIRTDSAQSDSSGFADEVMDSTVISNSPCIEDCSFEGSSRPEMGHKLIQTSFDDFGVLESFDRDECPVDAVSGRTPRSFEDEKNSESEKSSSLSSMERIARSRKSFRESRGSYERMGSTFSGISISSLEDSPFEWEGTALPVRSVPVPRQRSGTYPAAADKQEVPSAPKTVLEILTTLQQNIKQATEAENLVKDEEAGQLAKKHPTLSKMKSVVFDCFPLDDIPSLKESMAAIDGHDTQPSASLPDKTDTNKPSIARTLQDLPQPSSAAATENGVVEETGKSSPKLLKRKSSQISMVPTLPCLDEEKTPAHSRHSSVTDTTHAAPRQNANHCADSDKIQEISEAMDQAVGCTADGKSEELDCADLRSDTDTPVSMLVNADSIGDVGDLEEEMRYLEHVESLLQQEGKRLDEASHRPFQEEAACIVLEVESNSHSIPPSFVTSEALNQSRTTVEISLSKADQPSHSKPMVEESRRPFQEEAIVLEVESNSHSSPPTFFTSEALYWTGTTVQGSLSEEDQPSHSRPKVEESHRPRQEEIEPNCNPSPATFVTSEALNRSGTTMESSLSKADQPIRNHSGICRSLPDAGDKIGLAKLTVIPNASCSQSAKLVESSVCLYLMPTPFVIDFSTVPDGVCEAEQLCNCPDAELVPKRYRTSLELALDRESPEERNCNKNVNSSEEIVVRVKPEDDLHDMKLIQRALFKYKQDLCELESLAERLYSRHLDEDEGEEDGGMTERERAELESVRHLRRQVIEEVEIMEGQLAQRMRMAIVRTNFPDGLENSLMTASEDNLEVIQEMVNLLEEQRTLRRMLQDLEMTHSHPSLSEASTVPDLSAVGSGEWAESYQGAEEVAEDKREMMQALTEVRMELQLQREAARREMNSAVKEMRQAIISELRQELHLDAQLFQRQLQAKDKEIEQLKTLLREQRMLQDGK